FSFRSEKHDVSVCLHSFSLSQAHILAHSPVAIFPSSTRCPLTISFSIRLPLTVNMSVLLQFASGANRKAMTQPDSFIQRQRLDASMADTFLEHLCLLNIDQEPITARNTSIICTIGPASRSIPKLHEMMKAGMNIARLNFSHGSHEYHSETIKNIREAVETITPDPLCYCPVAIALDTKGPEIRTGLVKGVNLLDKDATDGKIIWVDYSSLPKVLKTGSMIYIDDGLIGLKVLETGPDWVDTVVESGGQLCSRKGVNLPGSDLIGLQAVSQRDEADLRFGVAQGVDIVFASFIRSAQDVKDVRRTLGAHGRGIKVISKVESRQGVKNFEEILAESDGVMVARGDLGIEIPAEKVFIAQKMMIGRCNSAGKPVICATQMLESMVAHPRPTRAEGSDVANAVLDGADCVMLSGETAKGLFPVQAVAMMHSICREAEAAIFHQQLFEELRRLTPLSSDPTEVTAIGAVESSFKCCAGAIIVLTTSGRAAHLLSRYRPRCPIIAITRSPQVARQSQLLRGVFPVLFHPLPAPVWADDVDNRVNFGMDIGKARGFFKSGQMVIVVTGWIPGSGHTNIMRAVSVP
uniref:Pyruvate kinase n=1 Tax=Gasterosteus aculeatus aculeatus TaxID=481459 RepID=A0AAQ4P6H1_GASAC